MQTRTRIKAGQITAVEPSTATAREQQHYTVKLTNASIS
jgi:hypothetical protein